MSGVDSASGPHGVLSQSIIRPIVHHQHILEMRFEDFDKRLMSWMRQVSFSTFLVGKRDEEAVCEPLVQLFGTIVDSPLEVNDLVDLAGQRRKRGSDPILIGLAGVRLELEQDDVPQPLR